MLNSTQLQPDNILLTSAHPGARIILTDFGTAKQTTLGSRMLTFVGTIEYTAPFGGPPTLIYYSFSNSFKHTNFDSVVVKSRSGKQTLLHQAATTTLSMSGRLAYYFI